MGRFGSRARIGNDARQRDHLLRTNQLGGGEVGLAAGDRRVKTRRGEGEPGAFAQLVEIEETLGLGQLAPLHPRRRLS